MDPSGLSVFVSVARGDAGPHSNVDLAARFNPVAEVGMVSDSPATARTLARANRLGGRAGTDGEDAS